MSGSKHRSGEWPTLAFGILSLLLFSLSQPLWSTPFCEGCGDGQLTFLEDTGQASHSSFERSNWTGANGITTNVWVDELGHPTLGHPELVWATGDDMKTYRTGLAVVADPTSNLVYAIGGREDPDINSPDDQVPSKAVEVYDPTLDMWTSSVNLPEDIEYTAGAYLDGHIYVVGDWHPGTSESSGGQAMKYNISSMEWTSISPVPNGRGYGGLAALDGYLYFAGGVSSSYGWDVSNKVHRYDPGTGNWTEVASLTHERYGLGLVSAHGHLYAIGGGDGGVWWGGSPKDYFERYNPLNDTWVMMPPLPTARLGLAAAFHNGEIVTIGGVSANSGYSVVEGFDIENGSWRSTTHMSPESFDHGAASVNGTLVVTGGDESQSPHSQWPEPEMLRDTRLVASIDEAYGFYYTPLLDLRPFPRSSVFFRAANFSVDTPNGTSAGLRYRSHSDPNILSQSPFIGPEGVESGWFAPGELPIILNSTTKDIIQLQVRLSTEVLDPWTTPSLTSLSVSYDYAAFTAPIQTQVSPYGTNFSFQTKYSLVGESATYHLRLVDGNGLLDAEVIADDTGIVAIDDQNGLISDVGLNLNHSGDSAEVDWWLKISDSIQGNWFSLSIGIGNTTGWIGWHDLGIPITIDRELVVDWVEIRADWAGEDETTLVHDWEAMPSGTEINITCGVHYSLTGDSPANGAVVFSVNKTFDGTTSNSLTAPFNSSGLASMNITLPSGVNGVLEIALIPSTTLSEHTITLPNPVMTVVLDDDIPFVDGAVTPQEGAYLPINSAREVIIPLNDTSGFNHSRLKLYNWVEGRDDGTDGNPMDGSPQLGEYQLANVSLSGGVGGWFAHATIDDTVNHDHQMVSFWLSGVDYVGHQIEGGGGVGFEDQLGGWSSRVANLTQVISVNHQTPVDPLKGQLIEPMLLTRWEVTLWDSNSISDVKEVFLTFGDDENLGLKYIVSDGSCEELDVRMIVGENGCFAEFEDGNMKIDFGATPTWLWSNSGLEEGRVSVTIVEHDGVNSSWFDDERWYHGSEVIYDATVYADISGVVTGNLSVESMIAGGDTVSFSGLFRFVESGNSVTGDIVVRWAGGVDGEQWAEYGVIQLDTDGHLYFEFETPLETGVLTGRIEVWDPNEVHLLGSFPVPESTVDATPPILQLPIKEMESRYRLDNVTVTVGVDEREGWNGNLTISCMVHSDELDWEVHNLSGPSVLTYDDLLMWRFDFDHSQDGSPSLLAEESHYLCWVEGHDDAGNFLVPIEGGNSPNTPWLDLLIPSDGPDLYFVEILSSEIDAQKVGPDGRIWMEVSVSDFGSGTDKPVILVVEVSMEGGETFEVARKVNEEGLDSGEYWNPFISIPVEGTGDFTLTIRLDPDQDIAELDEQNNIFSIEMQRETVSEGLFAGSKGVAITGGALVLLLAILFTIGLRTMKGKRTQPQFKIEVEQPRDPLGELRSSSDSQRVQNSQQPSK